MNLKTTNKVLVCFSIVFCCLVSIKTGYAATVQEMEEELAITERAERILDFLNLQKYERAYRESNKLLESSTAYPAPELVELGRRFFCRKYLMRSYAYLAEGNESAAKETFIHAGDVYPDYTNRIAKLYEKQLNSSNVSDAANYAFVTLQAEEEKDILLSKQIRHEVWQQKVNVNSKLHEQELSRYSNEAKNAVEKGDLKRADANIEKYLKINPLDEEAQALSMQVKQALVTRELEKAWPLLARGNKKAAYAFVVQANRIAPDFVKEEANKYFKQAMEFIINGQPKKSKEPMARASLLSPEDEDIERLDNFLQGRADIFPYALDLFNNEKYEDAARWMSLYAHVKPDDERGQYYARITSAYKNIQDGSYWTARENLVEALKIDPSKENSLILFERLEEVLEALEVR